MGDRDSEWVLRAQKGERLAFEELVHRYDDRVLRLALRYTRNREDAKDVYQEIFVRVFRSLRQFRFQSAFSTWLFRIAVNACLSFKANGREPSQASGWEDPERKDSGVHLRSLEPDAYRRAVGAEITVRIESALGRLSPQQKMVFILKHFEGFSLKEISSFLGCSEGTVKKHFFLATQRMRQDLRDFLQQGVPK